ncbi:MULTISPECIES: hypothetical protein [Streptomyces]|uniref:Uncharacterized protein n=3 Tax=Streptomyces TaxID=1883 RepID=A0A1I6W1C2_9ACTN|nr:MULTISPECIES: hypothetical protein [Streptomyces]QKV70976.1 hypothetical protein HUT13_21060 [Streptomyces harbinensis]UWM51421.1 hypothetical protein N0X72_21775 [Streptomyces carpaticus]SFT19745.1 hypothetical protein SAMN05444716_111132 [Streptomyces harbinensis]
MTPAPTPPPAAPTPAHPRTSEKLRADVRKANALSAANRLSKEGGAK